MKISETTNLGTLERELERFSIERVTCRIQRGVVWLELLRYGETPGTGLGASGTSLAQALDRAIVRLGQGG